MSNPQLPSFVTQYFWGDDLSQLNFSQNKKYILQVLLERGNKEAIHWLFSIMDKNMLRNILPTLRLSEKSAHFWSMYLS